MLDKLKLFWLTPNGKKIILGALAAVIVLVIVIVKRGSRVKLR